MFHPHSSLTMIRSQLYIFTKILNCIWIWIARIRWETRVPRSSVYGDQLERSVRACCEVGGVWRALVCRRCRRRRRRRRRRRGGAARAAVGRPHDAPARAPRAPPLHHRARPALAAPAQERGQYALRFLFQILTLQSRFSCRYISINDGWLLSLRTRVRCPGWPNVCMICDMNVFATQKYIVVSMVLILVLLLWNITTLCQMSVILLLLRDPIRDCNPVSFTMRPNSDRIS